ncbi:MAG: bifunctional [glutamine synthetase] adenylyltransferase/[glutamine synthetase]-adenylyl-L-tyrosine phosphorylase [Candidatus Puniceispirillales bacterium WSBS_2018_MAG_OTU23]
MDHQKVNHHRIFPDVGAAIEGDTLTLATTTSPHLERLSRIYADDRSVIVKQDYDQIITAAKSAFEDAMTSAANDAELMTAIRYYRGRINHLVALTDFLNHVDVHQHMRWLSTAAEVALSTLVHVIAGDDAVRQGWFILALGKLGAQELNYSSDIDLIVITLNEHDDYDAAKRYIQLTRRITTIMSQPTKDGIGWRVDLRLRPDPGATAIAIQRDAAFSYYESMARTWERAAFIRARPVAGNLAAGNEFLDDLKPWIWRRYLDYTVLDDLKIMLRREPRPDNLLGYNVKTGMGGIRSIEFFIHAHQLIAGGREPDLRLTSTIPAINQLAKNKWITDANARSLIAAYTDLRRLEHRLQMIGDAQTHQMPKSDEAFANFAKFCGHDDIAIFGQRIIDLGDQVIDATKSLLEKLSNNNVQKNDDTLLYIPDDLMATHKRLEAAGFTAPQTVTTTCQGWLAGRVPATQSTRARDLLSKLLPRLLAKFAEHEHPDLGFIAFAQLVERLPAGLQLFSLIDSHDDIAQMIITIASSAPRLADYISRDPMLADTLLYTSFWQAEDDWPARTDELQKTLAATPHYEDQLSILRRQCHEWQFRTSAQLLQGMIDGRRAGQDYTAISDAIIIAALSVVQTEIIRRFGGVGGGISVYALGRCGSGEMTLTSDLDLLFIFDAAEDAASDGAQKILAKQYFVRFGQELINALSTQTAEGRCYEVDMRLRPSGNKGPLAVHIDGFEKYQTEDAWTWEHLALIKSRRIGGIDDDSVTARMEKLVPAIIKMPRDPEELVKNVNDMRGRLLAAMPALSPHDLRHRGGGVMDVDFIIQMLQMMPASAHLPVIRQSFDAIPHLLTAGLLTEKDAEALKNTILHYTDYIQWMRLTGIKETPVDNPNTPLPPGAEKRFKIKTFGDFDKAIDHNAEAILMLVKKYVCKN